MTCCEAACAGSKPPDASACSGRLSPLLGAALGLALGGGLGYGLGQDEPEAPLAREFQPFGLTDSLITAGAVAIAWRGNRLAHGPLPALCGGGSAGCRGGKDAVNGLDAGARRALVWSSPRARSTADALSYGTLGAAFAVPSGFLLGADQPSRGREMWLVVESAAVTSALLQVVKHRVHRPRPYAHYCEPPCGRDLGEHDDQLSFFSGHSALAFSFAVSTGTIASLRGYRHAGWVLGSGLAFASATAYLRIAADRHYLTDVLVGALVGSAVGWAVPKLHGLQDRPPDAVPAGRRFVPGPTLALPVPLKGREGLWLEGGVAGGPHLTVSWRF